MILGLSVYFLLMEFYFFGILGWIYECVFVFLRDHKFINRGFLVGPVLPLYGFGAVVIYLALRPVAGFPTLLYLAGAFLATALEYVTGWLLEILFHTKWWDYSEEPYNFRGRVALIPSMFWGILSLVMFDVLQPAAAFVIRQIPVPFGKNLLFMLVVITLCDLAYTVVTTIHLRQQLEKLYEKAKEMERYLEAKDGSYREQAGEFLKTNWKSVSDFLKKRPITGYQRLLDAFPSMKISWSSRKNVSVKELFDGMKKKTEPFMEYFQEKRK